MTHESQDPGRTGDAHKPPRRKRYSGTHPRRFDQRYKELSPATLLKWHRVLIARKYDASDRRGRRGPAPTKANMIHKLVLRMAEENPSWGYGHIHGELKGLGYDVSWQTVRRVMLDHGLLPDPDRPYKTTWNTFLASHWESIAARDFFSVEAWSLKDLARYMVFFVIDLAQPQGRDRRHPRGPVRAADAPVSQEPDRRRGRLPQGQAGPYPRSIIQESAPIAGSATFA